MKYTDLIKDHNVTGVIFLGLCLGDEIEEMRSLGVTDMLVAECNPHLFPIIEEKIDGKDDVVFIRNAVSDVSDEKADFFLHAQDKFENYGKTFDNPGCSSLFKLKDHLKYYPQISKTEKISVFTITIDDAISRLELDPKKYQMLVMDLQGGEFKALCGMEKTLEHIRVIHTELAHVELYEGGTTIKPVVKYLMDRGFKYSGFKSMHSTWGDGWFIRC